MTNRRSFIQDTVIGGVAAATCFAIPRSASAQSLSPVEARQIAEDAYIYGYSLITTEVTRVQGSNVPEVDIERLRAPLNQFVNAPKYPSADYRGVSAPNADTLYSFVGSTSPSQWYSATPIWAVASTCLKSWTFG